MGTNPRTGSDPKITLRLKSGSFGGHPRGWLLKLTQTEQGVGIKEGAG